jgi:hypothetical protein
LEDLIKEQYINEHIHIYTVEASKIEAFLQLDMAVFDKHFEFEQRVSHVGQIQEYLCSKSHLDISRRIRQFHSIMAKNETKEYDGKREVLALNEFDAGNAALSEGNWQEAQQRYEKAREFRYKNKDYITFNLAMVDVGKGKYSDACRELAEHYHPRADTVPNLHTMALRMMCEITEEGDGAAHKKRLKELEKEKKKLRPTYNYYHPTNPLIRLEKGLSKNPPMACRWHARRRERRLRNPEDHNLQEVSLYHASPHLRHASQPVRSGPPGKGRRRRRRSHPEPRRKSSPTRPRQRRAVGCRSDAQATSLHTNAPKRRPSRFAKRSKRFASISAWEGP